MSRPISDIARDISRAWPKPYFGAKPYLDAMRSLYRVSDAYGYDSGESVILYFLANASTFRGDAARALKAELKAALKG
jgi:hypothetical protein